MGTLLLIRHGQASYGERDYDRLSARGQEQARAVGRFLAQSRIDQLYMGPHKRHLQTATGASEAAGNLPDPTVLRELAEYPAFEMFQQFLPKLVAYDPKFAALTQTPTPELMNEGFHTVMGRWARDEWTAEGVERVSEFKERVQRGFDQIVRAVRSGARIAVVTSAGPIGVAVGLTFGATDLHMVRASVVIRNASMTELRFRSRDFDWHPERVSLITFNTTHHLPPELHTEY